MNSATASPLFSLGDLYFSANVSDLLLENQSICGLVGRHAQGDWGELARDMQAVNRAAIHDQDIVMSMYQVDLDNEIKREKEREKSGIEQGQKRKAQIWIVTEIDRGVTTVMLSTELGGGRYGR